MFYALLMHEYDLVFSVLLIISYLSVFVLVVAEMIPNFHAYPERPLLSAFRGYYCILLSNKT